MKLKTTPVLGTTSQTGWSRVFSNSDNSFVCLLTVSGQSARNVGLELFENLQNATIDSSEIAYQLLLDLQEKAQEKAVELELAAGFFEAERAVFACVKAQILLKRNEKVGLLLAASEDLKIIAGKPQVGDAYVFATSNATRFFPEIEQKLIQGFDVDTIVTSIIPGIHSLSDSSLSALLFIALEAESKSVDVELALQEELADYQQEVSRLEIKPAAQIASELDRNSLLEEPAQLSLGQKASKQFKLKIPQLPWRQSLAWLKKVLRIGATLGQKIFTKVKKSSQKFPQASRKFFEQDGIYVGQESRRRQLTRNLLIGALVAAPLIIFIFWYFLTARVQARLARSYLVPLQERLIQTKSKLEAEPLAARHETEIILEELDVLKEKFAKERFALKLVHSQADQASKFYESISGREEFQELPVFFDLRLVSADFISQAADASGKIAIFLDKEKNILVQLDLETLQAKELKGASGLKLNNLSFTGKQIYLLGQGIHSLDLNDQLAQLKIEGDSNREGNLISFFGDYLYVFNPDKRNLYRYAPGEEGEYSDPIGWLTDKQGLDFSLVKTMQIDGDIWLGTSDGAIWKFSRGENQDFTISGLKEVFSSPINLFTKEDLEYLYVLEPEKNRLVVLQKNGEFVKEIKSQTLSSTNQLIVNEAMKKAFGVSGSLLYEIEL